MELAECTPLFLDIDQRPGTRRVSRRGIVVVDPGPSGETRKAAEATPGAPPGSPLRRCTVSPVPSLPTDDGRPLPPVALKSWLLLAVLALTEFLTFASITVLSPFFPRESEEKGASSTAYGAIMGSFELAALVASVVCIKVVLLVKPRIVLLTGIALLTFGTLSFCSVWSLPPGTTFVGVSIFLRLVQGIGAGMIDVCSYMVVSYKIPQRVSLAIGVLEMAVGLGITAGPALGGVLYQHGGFYLPFTVVGVLTFVTIPGNFLLYPEAERKSSSSSVNLSGFLRNVDVVLGIVSITTGGITLGFLTSILEPRLRPYGLTVTEVGLVTVLPGAVFALLTPAWGHLADHLGESKLYFLLVFANLLSAVGYVLLGPAPGIPCSPTLWLMLLSLFVCGLGAAAQSISPFALMVKSTRKRGLFEDLVSAALVSAIHITCSTAGTSLGPLIGGIFMDRLGFDWFCLFMVLLAIAEMVFFVGVWFFKVHKRNADN